LKRLRNAVSRDIYTQQKDSAMESNKQYIFSKFHKIQNYIKSALFCIGLTFLTHAGFAQSNPCKFTEVHTSNSVIMKGEMNYMGSVEKSLRISVQFQMVEDETGLCIGVNNQDGLTMDSTNVAYVQLSNGKEYVLIPKNIQISNDNKRLECRYVVTEEDEQDFVRYIITGIFFSTNIHPQIELEDFNRHTARKISEKFKCAYEKIKNKKIQ
jgi:hypothetical protein